ncbi:hypothetical protein vseg_001217 [Gypsophila vaccaria]
MPQLTNLLHYIALIITFTLLCTITLQTTINPYNFLHIIPNSDGTITRIAQFFPTVPPNTSYDLAYSKDTLLNPRKNTWVRSYLPKNANQGVKKLPIIVYVHGGGFVELSVATPNFDRFCAHAAKYLGVIVVSVEYRLSPENRLPAAYDDVFEALYWLRDGDDEWVRSYGDVSKCVIMGESAGGNIAYYVGLRASRLGRDRRDALNPLVIKGLVLIQPFFGGVDRTGSELRLDNSGGLALLVTDLMWDLSLPVGVNRDYLYCNPFSGDGLGLVKGIRELDWRVVVAGCDGDPFYDRQVELVEWLKKLGVNVIGDFSEGKYHGVFVMDYIMSEKFFEFVRRVFSDIY